jgi:hypothetical protein
MKKFQITALQSPEAPVSGGPVGVILTVGTAIIIAVRKKVDC